MYFIIFVSEEDPPGFVLVSVLNQKVSRVFAPVKLGTSSTENFLLTTPI